MKNRDILFFYSWTRNTVCESTHTQIFVCVDEHTLINVYECSTCYIIVDKDYNLGSLFLLDKTAVFRLRLNETFVASRR